MVEVPLGERGEIIVKGPQVVEKYLDEVAKNITIKNGKGDKTCPSHVRIQDSLLH